MARQKKIEIDPNHCPVCGKPVVFVKELKPHTGKIGIVAYHEDEAPIDVEREITSDAYKRHRMTFLHKEPQKPKEIKPKEVVVENSVKEVVIMEPVVRSDNESEEPHEVNISDMTPTAPPVPLAADQYDSNDSKPEVDITDMKHNRFQMVGAVLKALKEAGWTDDRIKVVRSDLTENGKDTTTIIHVANQYVSMHENGLPVIMESGLVVPT